MFDDVAARYDLTNDVLSLGQDRLWRKATIAALGAEPGRARPRHRRRHRDQPRAVRRRRRGRRARRLLARDAAGRHAGAGPDLPFTAADAMHLPFADGAFDAVTMSFGLRNVADPAAALAEFLRVTQPGRHGWSSASSATRSTARSARSTSATSCARCPPVARRVSSNPDSYVYLAESIQAWPAQRDLATDHPARRLARRRVAQPLRRHRRAAPRHRLKRFGPALRRG